MMILKAQPGLLCMAATMALGLSACGGGDAANDASGTAVKEAATDKSNAPKKVAAALTLADGPDVCFRAIAKHLGADAKVSEITSFFSAGDKIESSDRKPAGEMTICKVQYQNPDDPRKLLDTSLDLGSGSFSEPRPVEISVMGNAAEFRLEDYLIPLSQIDAAALKTVMDAQKARLDGVYSDYAWSGVRLSSPGAFNDKHALRIDLTGRLAANDIKESGYALVSADGKKIITDHLMP